VRENFQSFTPEPLQQRADLQRIPRPGFARELLIRHDWTRRCCERQLHAFVSPRTSALYKARVRDAGRKIETPCGKDRKVTVLGLLRTYGNEPLLYVAVLPTMRASEEPRLYSVSIESPIPKNRASGFRYCFHMDMALSDTGRKRNGFGRRRFCGMPVQNGGQERYTCTRHLHKLDNAPAAE
jgi:hypothetical protein